LCERTMTTNTPKLQYSAGCISCACSNQGHERAATAAVLGGLRAYPKHRSNCHYAIASRLCRARDESAFNPSGSSPRISMIYLTPAHQESSFGFKSSNVLTFLAAADTVAYRASGTAHLDHPKSHVLCSYRTSNGHQQWTLSFVFVVERHQTHQIGSVPGGIY
jgi:hypothetical protein